MLKEHAKVLKMFAEAGEIVGRKKLQKIIFIAKKFNIPFYEKFDFHFYGPYSEELTLRVEELCNAGLLDEVCEEKGNYHQYRYTLTEAGAEFLQLHSLDMPNVKPLLDSLNEQSSRFLELVSTMMFFGDLEKEDIIEKVHTLKAKLRYTNDEIEKAFTYIETLQKQVN
ncbi:YwgA family protein [Bacillus sp. HMF5848]|uniref:YwgA family protein n=1 Tax=Bacillus sp. HMF5848 TaxID=2495421 RepID=UPI000F78E4BD|nr:YwgA family protein [Bacillus sp. HMF5848]RSK28993.1 YwgA family protein [Bacillus sp. HMF5848]